MKVKVTNIIYIYYLSYRSDLIATKLSYITGHNGASDIQRKITLYLNNKYFLR